MQDEQGDLARSRPIQTEADWRDALESANGLHDAIVKEVALISDSFVTSDGSLHFGRGGRVRVLVQTQNTQEPAAELFFRFVTRVEYDLSEDQELGGAARLSRLVDEDLPLWRFTFLECLIEAESCTIALLDARFLGQGPFYWPEGLATTDDLEAY